MENQKTTETFLEATFNNGAQVHTETVNELRLVYEQLAKQFDEDFALTEVTLVQVTKEHIDLQNILAMSHMESVAHSPPEQLQ